MFGIFELIEILRVTYQVTRQPGCHVRLPISLCLEPRKFPSVTSTLNTFLRY